MKLLTFPEQVHWTETREFNVMDDNGLEMTLRVIESPNGINVFVAKDNKMIMSEDQNLINWIENDLAVEEMRLEFEQREQKQISKENENTTYSDCDVIDDNQSSATN